MEELSDTEDSDIILAEKLWKRVNEAASKAGYREGIEEGSQAILQGDFDQGYEDGFKAAFELGKYKGLAAGFLKMHKHPQEIVDILEKTKRGSCYICALEKMEKSTIDRTREPNNVIVEHRKHVEDTLKILREYFDPLMQERGFDENQLKPE